MKTVMRNAAHKTAMVFAGFAIIGAIVCYVLFLLVSIPEINTTIVPIYPSILVTVILLIIASAFDIFSKRRRNLHHSIGG